MASLPGSAALLRALVAAGCLFPIIGACGGRSDTEDYLFGSDGTISVGASSNSGAGRGSTRGGTPASGGTTGTAGRGTITAGSGPITMGGKGTVGGGGPIPDAGEPSGGGAVGGSSVGGAISMGGVGVAGTGTAGTGGSPVVPLACGNQTCDANTQVCCAGLGGFGCLAKNKTCNGAVLSCTSNDDCAGNQVCCVAITGDIAEASSCKARCDNMGTGRDRQLCDIDADCLPPFRFCTATIFGINICTRRP